MGYLREKPELSMEYPSQNLRTRLPDKYSSMLTEEEN
jgi:hypothetical protein